MKIYIITILFLSISINFAHASIFPPNCVCEITALVLSVKEEAVKKDEFQKEDLTSLAMELKIISVGSMVRSGISDDMTCKQYKEGQKIKVYTIKERDFLDKKAAVIVGSIIKGNIEYSGDERGPWYNFDKIGVLTAPYRF